MKILSQNKIDSLPELVLFDFDNTLYDYAPAHEAAMQAVCSKVTSKFSVNQVDFERAFDTARSEIKQTLKDSAASHNRLLYMQRMLEILGLGSQALVALDLEQTYWRTFLNHAKLFPDVKECLDDLRLLGIQKILVTDLTAQIQFRKLVFFGLEGYFNYIVTSEESGFDKPHAASFQLALQKSKLENPTIWMIGDCSVKDIKGAKDAISAVTLQKIHNGVKLCDSADIQFNHFSELRLLLKNIVGK
jgi:putative hydrolase of the HAD superfamily